MIAHVQNVCKIGQGELCCRYLVVGGTGFQCMKVSPGNKAVVDRAWANTPHVSQGDNCEGVTDLQMKEGDFVHYIPISSFGKPENGRIKKMAPVDAFVVYSCNNEWHRYKEYTGELTAITNLKPGWVDKDGNPIDTPKTEEDENSTKG